MSLIVPDNLDEYDAYTFFYDSTSITYDPTKPWGSEQAGKNATRINNNTVRVATEGEPVIGWIERVAHDGTCVVVTNPKVKRKPDPRHTHTADPRQAKPL